jgi:hypothetical protein
MAAKSEHEYQGWKIRVTASTVGMRSSAMIEVWEPGEDPSSHTGVVLPFHKGLPSEAEAQAVALQTAKRWISRKAGGRSQT